MTAHSLRMRSFMSLMLPLGRCYVGAYSAQFASDCHESFVVSTSGDRHAESPSAATPSASAQDASEWVL